jgi:hypothetical protein
MKKGYLLFLFCATLLSTKGDLLAQNQPPSLRAEIVDPEMILPTLPHKPRRR